MSLCRRTLYNSSSTAVAAFYSKHRFSMTFAAALLVLTTALSCTMNPAVSQPSGSPQSSVSTGNADDFLIVDCLLPGKIIRLGTRATTIGPRRPVKTTALDCAIRGGEYVSYDRASYKTARNVWQAKAQQGDKEAQNYLGEIYERGMGIEPNYVIAAEWYRHAADQGYAPAQINLGKLYELGLGVPRDMQQALYWYRQASGLPDLQPAPELRPTPVPQKTPEKPPDKKIKGEKPTIQIIQPTVKAVRGVALISTQKETTVKLIVGKVISPNGLLTLTVNDKEILVDNNGIFKTDVPVKESGSEILIAAIDKAGLRTDLRLRIKPDDSPLKQLDFGRYHALVIGNNNYAYMNNLKTARSDAKKVSELLKGKYRFTVTTLYDATRYQIASKLNHLRETLTDEDNLLIYYAGHGELDKANNEGNWLPVDAEPRSNANWFPNSALTGVLNTMSVKHILVVADSCFSGTLTRSVLTELRPGQSDRARTVYLKAVLGKKSRTALTSGGLAPVLDEGGGGHSVFANLFIDILKSNSGVIEGQRLFFNIVEQVTYEASKKKFEQIPQYAPIKFSGHEAGDFFLVPST